MIELLISLLVFLVIASVILYAARLILSSFPVGQPFANIIYAIIVLILLILFLNEVGWVGTTHGWRKWR